MKPTVVERISRARLAENILLGRTLLGWSQERLGLESGLKRTYIGALERQEVNPGLDNLDKLAFAFGVAEHVLLLTPEEAHTMLRQAFERLTG